MINAWSADTAALAELSWVLEVVSLGKPKSMNRLRFLQITKICSLAIALGLHQTPCSTQSYPTRIHLTDGLPALLSLMNDNIFINMPKPPPSSVLINARILPWGEPIPSSVYQHPDVLLAADCAYIEESFPLLFRTLEHLMGQETVLFFCYKKRRKRDKDCIRMIGKSFEVQAIKGAWESEGVFLFEVRRRDAVRKQPGETERH